jgi:formate dehydrogenase alpha subunit
MAKNEYYVGSPQDEGTSICGFCGVGCSLVMGAVDNRIVDVKPSHERATVNRSTLCVRGHFAHDFLNSTRRLTSPLIRKDGRHCAATWEEALDAVAEKLLSVKREHGPQSLAFYGSSKCSIEENYIFQKIARVILGTNNVDNGGYFSGRSRLSRIHQRLDGGGRKMPLKGLEKAEAILVIGANPNESSPVVSYYLKRASMFKGLPVVVVDPRKTDLVRFAKIWLAPTPHTDDALINAVAAILHQRNACDIHFLQRYTRGFEGFLESLSSLNLERAARLTGVDRRHMESAADVLAGKKLAFVVGRGILQQINGLQAVDSLLNLALITGSLGKEGSGFYFPAAENNEMGAWDMGTSPDFLPGRELLTEDAARRRWESAWRVKLSPDPGLNIVRMIEEANEGNLKALYVMGENPCRSLPQPGQILKAFGKLEFLVVQDILENETTALADVVLPGAAFSEKAGAFTNMEGGVQHFRPMVSPPGDAKADWEILDLLGSRMGFSRQYTSLCRIRNEMKALIPLYVDMKTDDGPSWVAETSEVAVFDPDGKGDLIAFSPLPEPAEAGHDEEYPFKAILGTAKYHLGSGTRTAVSERIQSLALEGAVEISPDDGKLLGIGDGDSVRISSTYGTMKRRVKIERKLKPGHIFIPRGFNQNDVRNLLALTTLESPRSPGFKEINVTIEKVVTA